MMSLFGMLGLALSYVLLPVAPAAQIDGPVCSLNLSEPEDDETGQTIVRSQDQVGVHHDVPVDVEGTDSVSEKADEGASAAVPLLCFRQFCKPGLLCTFVDARKNCCEYDCVPDASCTALDCPTHPVCNPEGLDC